MTAETVSYEPLTDVKDIAAHLYALRGTDKHALTDADCLQVIADVATLYGTTEDNGSGWIFAMLPIESDRYIHISFNKREQVGSATIERHVEEQGSKTYKIQDSWSLIAHHENGNRVFYINDYQQEAPRGEVNPDDRKKVIDNLSEAFVNRALEN